MPQAFRIALLNFGNELLNGLRENTHLLWIGRELSAHGSPLTRSAAVNDDAAEIRLTTLRAWETSDIVITTGGLGPTADDLTRESIAAALGVALVHHPASEAALRERFARLGKIPTPNNLKQAFILAGAEALPNPNGTAPGQWFERDRKVLIMLPGPPNELQPMWRDAVIPRLRARGYIIAARAALQIRVAGIGESQIETELQPILAAYADDLDVAYCAHQGIVDVRLSAAHDALNAETMLAIGNACRERLGMGFATFGNRSLAEVAIEALRDCGRVVAVAESCTGGLLGSVITDIPGASTVFAGGVVCYSNAAKSGLLDVPDQVLQQHGAVSGECAMAMAEGVANRFSVDVGLSITGIAGPTGGSQEKPVGTVYIGLFFRNENKLIAHRIMCLGTRRAIKERAANAAIDFLRRALLESPGSR